MTSNRQTSTDGDVNLTKSQEELLEQQRIMDVAYSENQAFTAIPFDINSSTVHLPKHGGYKSNLLTLSPSYNKYNKLIFAALNQANHSVFVSRHGTHSNKKEFHSIFPSFVRFLNRSSNEKDHVKILKMFESYRVNFDGVKPQSSGLSVIKVAIKLAMREEGFRSYLSELDFRYLNTILKTKTAPPSEKDLLNLSNWISEHSWLRRDDVGVGHELFSRLASPKSTIKSFNCTTEVAFQAVLNAKIALIELFRQSNISKDDIPEQLERKHIPNKSQHDMRVRHCFLDIFDTIRAAYHAKEEKTTDLDLAVKLFVAENVRESQTHKYLEAFFKNERGYNATSIVTGKSKLFFSLQFIRELAEFSSRPKHIISVTPACLGEHVLFHWLMASQTVQASDISKLSRSNFKFMERRDRSVTHIQLKYFKGRSNTFHDTRDIPANSKLGSALLIFVNQRSVNKSCKLKLSVNMPHVSSIGSLPRFVNFLQRELRKEIDNHLASKLASPVFIDSLLILFNKGKRKASSKETLDAFWNREQQPVKSKMFGPSLIKTTAVYAVSDTFDPTQLTNYHSHTNSTERKSYLTSANPDWENNCGRVTRAVMNDLTVNLFRASDIEKQSFNSEFMHAVTYIKSKSDETLSRMKIITNRSGGRVDALGFTEIHEATGEYSDTLYLTDSADTVLKLHHYLSESAKKHHLLAKHSPKFLLNNVLPTVEWIELLFQQKKFTTFESGASLYAEYKEDLPPLFNAHIR